MPHIKHLNQLSNLHSKLKEALDYANAATSLPKDTSVIDAMREFRNTKDNDDQAIKKIIDLGKSGHFEQFYPSDQEQDFEKPTAAQLDELNTWEQAIAYLVSAQYGFARYDHDILFKPESTTIINVMTRYKTFIQSDKYYVHSYPKEAPHYDYMIKEMKKEIQMCDTYIQRFTDNTDWVQRLLKPSYSKFASDY